MWITNGEILFLAFAFLVPGFVAQSIRSYFLPLKEKEGTAMILGYLTLAAINYGLWSWVLYLLLFTKTFYYHPYVVALICFAMIILSPMLVGVTAGMLESKGTVRRLLHKIGLQPMHHYPSGWDWKFASTQMPEIIHITLDNGREVRGLFGANSYASVFGSDYDIYLEEIFDYQSDGHWTRNRFSRGLWVAGRSIKAIEFIEAERKANDG